MRRGRLLLFVTLTALLAGIATVGSAQPFSAQIQRALVGFLTSTHTWTGAQTFTGQILAADGTVAAPSVALASTPSSGFYRSSAGVWSLSVVGTEKIMFKTNELLAGSGYALGWANTSAPSSGIVDTQLVRDGAADTMAMQRGTNAQTFRLYNTYTNASNYERIDVGWGGIAANTAQISVGAAGTGASRALLVGTANGSSGTVGLITNGATRWTVGGTTGHFTANTDNVQDIGASGATRPRTGYFGTSLNAPIIATNTSSVLTITANVIAPTGSVHHVGAGLIKTITVPAACTPTCTINIIPDDAYTYDATGNIVVPAAGGLAIINKLMTFTWDGTKWTPSY